MWKLGGDDGGAKWTCKIMTDILSYRYRAENRGANRGVVKEALVKSLICQLLGTGNDIRYYLLINVFDTLFGYCPQYLLDIQDDVYNSKTVIA